MSTSVSVTLLGPFRMTVGGAALPLGTPKQRAVLAVLVLNHNRAVPADTLIDAVWGDQPPAEARASLHAYVSNLRRLLRTAEVDHLLETASGGYRVLVDEKDVDLDRFVAARAAGLEAAAEGRFDDAAAHLSSALAQWQGDFLADLRGFPFVQTFEVALTEDRISAHTVRAQAEIACGRADTVIGELEELVARYPYREPLWAQLMTAYYLAHRQSDALDVYRRVKDVLADDLGIDPAPELRDLHALVLRQAPLNIGPATKKTAADTMAATVNRLMSESHVGAARLRTPAGRTHPLTGAVTRIGRHSGNDIVLGDPRVSRHHAVVIASGTGYVIIDAGSANGIHLRDNRVHGSAELHDGDRIGIGDGEFVFEHDGG
ncbi:FHA domain-containing protein [Mycolicibacterium sp. 018/SC-01/001]|uniref:BTAD domain-containing putative transcriptional regulator n=1 Tax=Mycolicibacterium sp. 018/SC-01/001 TaxID=2592069 RepID=UPI00118065C9|nr:BTAD domain-containing putative transcriptional regulator [Mycolicibacterium sp. 018/SC-01/001]TRW88733.1 FHA domain-containing protein [Mycolicibacterium sp. 018/SC-01/001]